MKRKWKRWLIAPLAVALLLGAPPSVTQPLVALLLDVQPQVVVPQPGELPREGKPFGS